MAAVVHGCSGNSSPRDHHDSNITSCSSLAHRSTNTNQHPTPTPMMYSTNNKIPKYSRNNASSAINKQHHQHHLYGGIEMGSSVVERGGMGMGTISNPLTLGTHHQTHSFNSTLPPATYLGVSGSGANSGIGGTGGVGGSGGGGSLHHHSYTAGVNTMSTNNDAACRNYWGHPSLYRGGRLHNKRKSAVELLAETRPFFIKSDTVMDRLQQSSYRCATIASAGKRGRSCADGRADELAAAGRYQPSCYPSSELLDTHAHDARKEHRYSIPSATATGALLQQQSARSSTYQQQQQQQQQHHRHHHHDHHSTSTHRNGARHSAPPSSSTLLQSKVRMLLASSMCAGESAAATRERVNVGMERGYRGDLLRKIDYASGRGNRGGNELTSISFSNDDEPNIRQPPPAFLTPQSFDNVYAYGAENSSGDEPLVLTENYRPISPPAEYAADAGKNDARARYNYQRSHSHSHEMAVDSANSQYNINSHKSLPDLHSQISRHSPHSEILSCCSRGNRSIKSAGESSLNRDSGGSSGHYTHRSEPCYRQQRNSIDHDMYAQASTKNCCLNTLTAHTPMEYRRDSGSSTQHSANSNCAVGRGVGGGIGGSGSGGYASSNTYLYSGGISDCAECSCKSVGDVVGRYESDDYLFNFPTPEVPEAFQDDYTPPSPSQQHARTHRYGHMEESRISNEPSFQNLQLHHHRKQKTQQEREREREQQDQQQQQQLQLFSTSVYSGVSFKSPKSPQAQAQSPGSAPSIEDISPPPIQFKRQRCIRFKTRNRISLPNAPSSSQPNSLTAAHSMERVEATYHGDMEKSSLYFFPKCFSTDTYIQSCKNYTDPPMTPQSASSPHSSLDNHSNKSNEREQKITLNIPGGGGGGGADDNIHELESFFDRLGLNDEKFHEIYSVPRRRQSGDTDSEGSSTVFFSDVSTVDSMRLPDSTETQPQTAQPYRPSEPPSIVERNARIIKWLCNCRKLQYV